MEIKLIALDMDGTLLDNDHVTIPPRNISALRAAAERGAAVTIASGRCWSLLTEAAEALGVVQYAVLANGASVLEVETGRWLVRHCLPEEQWKKMFEILREFNLPFEVYGDGMNYVERRFLEGARELTLSPDYTRMFEAHTLFPECLDEALTGKAVEKLHIFRVTKAQRAALIPLMEATGPVAVANAFAENLEFTTAGVSKAGALEELCGRIGIASGEVMAFGDANNDLEMLSWAGWSFAMGNATPEAKAAARYQTASNHQAGVGVAVETYLLGQAEAPSEAK